MKFCKFLIGENESFGILKGEALIPADWVPDRAGNPRLIPGSSSPVNPGDVRFLPPVTPSKIVGVGRNYADHAKELGNVVPKVPLLFLKAPSAIIAHEDNIVLPRQSVQVEHEGELAVVIGRTCKDLGETEDPLDYVLGYTCLNDVTARDLQKKDGQFSRAKSFDTFCPVGAFIETDTDVTDLRIITRVNNKIKQEGRTSQMIFDIPFLIRYISQQMTLYREDIIATGTPSGVSKLTERDICEIEIESIGILRNTVIK